MKHSTNKLHIAGLTQISAEITMATRGWFSVMLMTPPLAKGWWASQRTDLESAEKCNVWFQLISMSCFPYQTMCEQIDISWNHTLHFSAEVNIWDDITNKHLLHRCLPCWATSYEVVEAVQAMNMYITCKYSSTDTFTRALTYHLKILIMCFGNLQGCSKQAYISTSQ